HRYERLLLLHDTATLWFFTLSLHDALPIYLCPCFEEVCFKDKSLSAHVCIADLANVLFTYTSDANAADCRLAASGLHRVGFADRDRKSTRLNSSHVKISYAVFCLKKKKNNS